MVFTRKFSEFNPGTVEESVGLTAGANTIGPAGGGGGSGSVIQTITQDTSSLIVSRWVRFDNATQLYVHGIATSAELAEIDGVVLEILGASQFKLQQSGYIDHATPGFSGFSTAGTYFLSDSMSGVQTLTPPTDNGHIRLPLFIADSTDSGWVCSLKSGMVIGTPGPIPSSGGGGTDSSIHIVDQPGNTFNVSDWVRVSGDMVYSLADGSSFNNSQSVGVVIDDGDPLFTVQFSGFNSGSVIGAVDSIGTPILITSSTVYYLSDVAPGKITPTKPTALFSSVKPCYISESSTSITGFVLPQRPLEVGPNDGDAAFVVVTQALHGFGVEDIIRVLASGTYIKAQANNLINARAVGIVVQVIDVNTFVLQTSGFSDVFTGKTPATQYYLDNTTPGLLTSAEPGAAGTVSKPIFEALTATSGYILEQRPMLQPNANGGGSGGGSIPSNVIQSIRTADFSVATGVDWPITVTITPSSITSRIKISFFGSGLKRTGGAATVSGFLKRNGVLLTVGGVSVGMGRIETGQINSKSFLYIDSPATTLAVTYSFVGIPFFASAATVDYDTSQQNKTVLSFIAEEVGP